MLKFLHRLHPRLTSLLHGHWLRVFGLMCVSVTGFGLVSYDFFFFLKANLTYIEENGLMGLADGGLQQLVSLMLYGLVSLFFYVIFKACEKTLVERMTKK